MKEEFKKAMEVLVRMKARALAARDLPRLAFVRSMRRFWIDRYRRELRSLEREAQRMHEWAEYREKRGSMTREERAALRYQRMQRLGQDIEELKGLAAKIGEDL